MTNQLEELIRNLRKTEWVEGKHDPASKLPHILISQEDKVLYEWYLPELEKAKIIEGSCAVKNIHPSHLFPINVDDSETRYMQQCPGIAEEGPEYWEVVDDIAGQRIICDVPSEEMAERFAGNYASSTIRTSLRVQKQEKRQGGFFSYINMGT